MYGVALDCELMMLNVVVTLLVVCIFLGTVPGYGGTVTYVFLLWWDCKLG